MELQISPGICSKVSTASDLWEDKDGHRKDTQAVMRNEASRDTGSRSVPGSYPHACEYPAKPECVAVYGIPKGKKFTDDI